MPPVIEFPLDLPDVRIVHTDLSQSAITIRVESTRTGTRCRQCGAEIQDFHGYGERLRLRHLPILGRPVFIELRPRRYRCPLCEDHPTTTQQLEWYEARSPHTKAYDQWLLRWLIGSTIEDVVRKEGLTSDVVLGAVARQVAGAVNWAAYPALGIIGLDEIALRKGHDHFIVLVTPRRADGTVALLGILPDRKKETVVAFLRSIPVALRATITDVCTDMYEGYGNAVKEEVQQARVIIDRFHVAKAYRAGADALRKEVLRDLKAQLTKDEYQFLKGTMWPFRRAPNDLTAEEKERLALLLEVAPDLRQAYDLREKLTAIFDRAHSKTSGTAALKRWMKQVRASGLSCFDRFLTTLETWLDEITNYFVARLTSGFVEGFNNKVKVLKRRCYGITNLTHLFQRLYLDLEGYRLFGL
jgi:transposase